MAARVRKLRIGLSVNHPNRDLPGMVLVARTLVERGAEVYLVPKDLLRQEALYLKLDLVLLNYLRTTNERHARRLLEGGTALAVLDAEGGVMPSFDWFRVKLPRDEKLLKGISVFCSWGSHVAERAVGTGLFEASQVAVTGYPKMDFYREPFRGVVHDLTSELDRFTRPLVLINTRFSLVNPEFGSRDGQRMAFVKRFGLADEEVARWQGIMEHAVTGMADTANQLARRFPEVTFVFRVHPFESEKPYSELLEPLPNLHLLREGGIEGWLLRADAVIHRCCSTAIEAGLVGIPSFSTRWIALHEEIESTECVSVPCDNFEALATAIGEVARGTFHIPHGVQAALEETIGRWFYRIDGQSHLRVAERLLSAAAAPRAYPAVPWRNAYYGANYPTKPMSFGESMLWKALALLRLPVALRGDTGRSGARDNRKEWDQSPKAYDAGQVQGWLDRLGADGQRMEATPVRPVGWLPGIVFRSVRIARQGE